MQHLRGPARSKGIITGTITGMVAKFLGPGGDDWPSGDLNKISSYLSVGIPPRCAPETVLC